MAVAKLGVLEKNKKKTQSATLISMTQNPKPNHQCLCYQCHPQKLQTSLSLLTTAYRSLQIIKVAMYIETRLRNTLTLSSTVYFKS